MDYLFWLVMALTFVWYMCDGGVQSISEWWAVRRLRREIKEYDRAREEADVSHL